MAKANKRLGRGLSSLVSGDLGHAGPPGVAPPDQQPKPDAVSSMLSREGGPPAQRLMMIHVERIRQNPMQPRREFDPARLATLADSLKRRGALQPIVVRAVEDGYELVAGERRLRAARLAELPEIPAIVRSVPDDQLLELALIENIHRADLNPVERARAYQILHQQHGLSHEEVGKRVGEDRATVSNYIRLLTLPEDVLAMITAGELTTGHAKAILGARDKNTQAILARQIAQENWSVRRTETEVAQAAKKAGGAKAKVEKRPAVADMEDRLSAAVGTRVAIQEGRRRHAGKLVIEYYNLDDFERITGLLGIDAEGP